MVKISPSDRKQLYEDFPDLSVISSQEIRGELVFCASMDDKKKRLIQRHRQYPLDSVRQAHGFIEERFSIYTCFVGDDKQMTWEIGGRIQSHYKKLKSIGEVDSISDMHVYYPSEAVCLGHPECVKMVIRKSPSLATFIEDLLVPYFYFHGYWKRYGKQPWEGLSHCLGMATLQQIASDENNIRLYLKQIHQVVEDPNLGFRGKVTPDARRGMKILLRWLRAHNRDRSFSSLISHLSKIHFN